MVQKVMLNVSTVWKNWEKKTKILYYKHMNSRKRSSCKGDGPELLQMLTRVRSLCSLICLHLFRLSAKDRLLLPTRLQRLTNPKKKLSLEFALNGLSCFGAFYDGGGECVWATQGSAYLGCVWLCPFCSIIFFHFDLNSYDDSVKLQLISNL